MSQSAKKSAGTGAQVGAMWGGLTRGLDSGVLASTNFAHLRPFLSKHNLLYILGGMGKGAAIGAGVGLGAHGIGKALKGES